MLSNRHDLLVRSLVVLLAPKAGLANLTGIYEETFPEEEPHLRFRYRVLRLWETSPESWLTGGLALLPLTPLSRVREGDLPEIVTRMKSRLDAEATPAEKSELWTAIYTLMGLRYQSDLTNRLLRGVIGMEESVTYQAIIEKGIEKGMRQGALREARKTLLLQGETRFGAAPDSVRNTLEAMDDLEKLEQLAVRVLSAGSWEELLGQPPGRKKRGKKSS